MIPSAQSGLAFFGYMLITVAIALVAFMVLLKYHHRAELNARLRPPGEPTAQRTAVSLEWLLPASTVRRMKRNFDRRTSRSALSISWSSFLMLSVLCGIGGFLIGAVYFKNVLAGIGLGFLSYMIPDQVLSMGAGISRDRTHEQLQLAIQTFSAEYRTGRSIARAFLRTAPQLPDPIRAHFLRAANRINNSEPLEAVLEELSQRLDHPYARLFCANCKAVDEDQSASELFDAISYQLNQWRIRRRSNIAALSGGKMIGLILNATLPVVYFVSSKMVPVTRFFLTETAGGRAMTVVMVLGALVTVAINKYLAEAEW